jgi:hypothetical protein
MEFDSALPMESQTSNTPQYQALPKPLPCSAYLPHIGSCSPHDERAR